ncbi:MAG: hypothetical protein IKO42_04530, partial [Opitutales bacterium]|nr:hypothetical protein [Opitutales bacterium]
FICGETRGTYSYKWNKNGTGLLKLAWSDGKDKYVSEISLLALSANSGIAVIATSWNEGKDKFVSSLCEPFEF